MDNNLRAEPQNEISVQACDNSSLMYQNEINNVYMNSMPLKKEKPSAPFFKRDLIYFILIFFSVVVYIRFSFFGGYNLGFTVSNLIITVILMLYARDRGSRPEPFAVMCGVFAIALSVPFALYTDIVIKTVSLFAMLFLNALFLAGVAQSIKCTDGSYMLCSDVMSVIFFYPINHFSMMINSLKTAFSGTNKKEYKNPLYVLVGVVVSIPLLAVIVPLLMSSDAAFSSLINKIFGSTAELLVSILIAIIAVPFVISCVFSLAKGAEKLTQSNIKKEKIFGLSTVMINTILTVLSACYLMYLLSQTAYFFSAFGGLLPDNYTAAEYARRGFFEMCAVAAINICIFFAVYILTKRTEDNRFQKLTKGLLTFVSVFTLILITTALSKMIMYIDRFGLTRLRVLTTCFMLMLLLSFLTLMLKLFIQKLPYMKIIVVIAAVVLTAVSYMDVDTQIAKYNTHRYLSGSAQEIDMNTIGELSYAKIPYVIKLYNEGDEVAKSRAESLLSSIADNYNRYDYYYNHDDYNEYGEYREDIEVRDYNDYDYNDSGYYDYNEFYNGVPENAISINTDTDFISYNMTKHRGLVMLKEFFEKEK